MKTAYRKILDKSFTYVAYASLAVIALAILTFLAPIVYRGVGAVIFNATVEHEKFLIENLGRSPTKSDEERIKLSNEARAPLYEMMDKYESPSDTSFDAKINTAFDAAFESMKKHSQELLSSLELKGAERGKRIAQISEKIWADYIGEVDKASSDAKKDGTSFALIKVLKGQDERLADAVRREVAYLNSIKKLNFMQKSLIRRNASAGIKKHIDAVVSELDEQNAAYKTFKEGIVKLLGQPDIKSKDAVNLLRQKYGQTRMDMARSALEDSVLTISVKAKDSGGAEYSETEWAAGVIYAFVKLNAAYVIHRRKFRRDAAAAHDRILGIFLRRTFRLQHIRRYMADDIGHFLPDAWFNDNSRAAWHSRLHIFFGIL